MPIGLGNCVLLRMCQTAGSLSVERAGTRTLTFAELPARGITHFIRRRQAWQQHRMEPTHLDMLTQWNVLGPHFMEM